MQPLLQYTRDNMVNDLFILMWVLFGITAFVRRNDRIEMNTFAVLSISAFAISLYPW